MAGFDHINEHDSSRRKWMAAEFQDISGINPFTIDQVQLMNNNFSKENWLIATDSLQLKKKFKADLYIAAHFTNTHSPINEILNHKEITIKISLKLRNTVPKYSLLSVFLTEELKFSQQAIPVHNLLLEKDIEQTQIHLPVGNYTFRVTNEAGKILSEKNETIETENVIQLK